MSDKVSNVEMGELIGRLRAQGYRLQELATRCGVTPMTILFWQRGGGRERSGIIKSARRHMEKLDGKKKDSEIYRREKMRDGVQELLGSGKWNQSTLARRLEVPRPTVSKWAAGAIPQESRLLQRRVRRLLEE